MSCMECGASVKSRRVDHRYVESGLPNVVLTNVEFRRCAKCGAEERVMPRLAQLHRAIAEAIADKTTRLTGAEIRFLRKQLGWSGENFAAVMGVRPETVSRWELEREPMGVVSERLLRLMSLRTRPVESYPNERLAEVAKDAPQPLRLRLRNEQQGWHAE